MKSESPSVWAAPGYLPTIISVACSFSGWALLLPVLPFAVLDTGQSAALAGATTGVFMVFSVLTQLITPAILRRWGYQRVMVVASLLLGVPALIHIVSLAPVPVLLVCAVRGIGFGAVSVAESALIAELVPRSQVGRAAAYLGVAVGLPQALLLPSGLTLAAVLSTTVVYSVAAVLATGAAVCAVFIPAIYPAPRTPTNARPTAVAAATGLPGAAICAAAFGFASLAAFLPAALGAAAVWGGILLGISGASQMVARFLAGILADRWGPSRLLVPGQVCVTVGLIGIIGGVMSQNPWLLAVAVAVHGMGYGAIQNDSLLTMYHRLPTAQLALGSTIWNAAFDGGNGMGALLLGLVVATTGSAYSAAFATAAATMGVVLAMHIIARSTATDSHQPPLTIHEETQ